MLMDKLTKRTNAAVGAVAGHAYRCPTPGDGFDPWEDDRALSNKRTRSNGSSADSTASGIFFSFEDFGVLFDGFLDFALPLRCSA